MNENFEGRCSPDRSGSLESLIFRPIKLTQLRVFGEFICVESRKIVEVLAPSSENFLYSRPADNVIYYQGVPIPLVDLRLETECEGERENSVILIFKFVVGFVGVLVEEVTEVFSKYCLQLDPVDEEILARFPYIREKVNHGGIDMPLIDIERMLVPKVRSDSERPSRQ